MAVPRRLCAGHSVDTRAYLSVIYFFIKINLFLYPHLPDWNCEFACYYLYLYIFYLYIADQNYECAKDCFRDFRVS